MGFPHPLKRTLELVLRRSRFSGKDTSSAYLRRRRQRNRRRGPDSRYLHARPGTANGAQRRALVQVR